MKVNKWIEIASEEIFKIWKNYTGRFHIEVICPYCRDITFICLKTEEDRLRLRCGCEIPKIPTPKTIEIILTFRYPLHGWIRGCG